VGSVFVVFLVIFAAGVSGIVADIAEERLFPQTGAVVGIAHVSVGENHVCGSVMAGADRIIGFPAGVAPGKDAALGTGRARAVGVAQGGSVGAVGDHDIPCRRREPFKLYRGATVIDVVNIHHFREVVAVILQKIAPVIGEIAAAVAADRPELVGVDRRRTGGDQPSFGLQVKVVFAGAEVSKL